MDNNHRPRNSFSRTPLSSSDEQDRNERGYPGYNSHHRHNRPSISSPSGGFSSYSSLGEHSQGSSGQRGSFSHYHRRESYNRPRGAAPDRGWDATPSKERERDKDRDMGSIYGRGDDAADDTGSHKPKKYHNPCRFAGHDHEWRDCPNNYRNKNKRPGSFSMGKHDYKKEGGGGGELNQGIGRSTSWGTMGGDYYGPAPDSTGSGGASQNSDWNYDHSSRGYKCEKYDGSRSKSFAAERTSHEPGMIVDRGDRGFDNEGAPSALTSDPSPHNATLSGDKNWHQSNSRPERTNHYSPSQSTKPRPSLTTSSIPYHQERGYSFTSLSPPPTGYRRGSLQTPSNISAPPFHRSQSYDGGSIRDVKKEQQQVEDGDSTSYRKLSGTVPSTSQDPLYDLKLPQSHGGPVHRGQDEMHTASKGYNSSDAPPTASSSAAASKPLPPKEELVAPSLTCAELGAAEKVSKAEDIVAKMNALMNKPTSLTTTSGGSTESVVPLPSKNEILKCMAVIDGKIKAKDDDAASVKKRMKEMEREKLAEEERLLKQNKEKRQELIDGVANRKSERNASIQVKEDSLAETMNAQKAYLQEELTDEILRLQKDCANALKTNAAKLNSEIALIQNQVDEAEMAIEEIDASLLTHEEGADYDIDESDFVPTLDAPGKMASLISSVLEDNQRIAAEAHHESMVAIPYFPQSENEVGATRNSPTSVITNEEWSNRTRKVTGFHDALYTTPSDVLMFNENNELFLEMAPKIKECLRVKKNKLKKRWEDLASQYLVRQMVFNKDTGINSTSERGGFFSITGRVDESGEIQPLGSVRGNNPYRRPRRGVSPGDVVRSDYEQEQIIAEIAAKEAMEKRIKEGGCALPRQRGMLENYLFATVSNGFLSNRVEDLMEDEEERRNVNIWTDMEKCIFFDRFLHHPKDFRKISSFLRNKSTKDCIAFYYNSKKTIPYKHALKEFHHRKKRHDTVVSWDATIQAALSIGAIIKPGDSPEKPLRFLLPHTDYTYRTHQFHPMQMALFDNLETVALHAKHYEESKSKPKRSNWFILDASSRKYIKHHKDDKDNSQRRKSRSLSDIEMEDITETMDPKKVQRTAEMSDVHGNKAVKGNKWRIEEKKLFFEAVEKFGHNWSKVSEYVGTRTMSQVKNYFYDNKKQTLKKKEKGVKPSKEEGTNKKTIKAKRGAKSNKVNDDQDLSSTNQSTKNATGNAQPNAVNSNTTTDVGMFMSVNQNEAEEQYRQLLEQQNQHYMQQQMLHQHKQQHEMLQERLLHQQMQRIHDVHRLQEVQIMEEELLRHQQQQWLAQFQQQQGNDWIDQQQLHNIQSILALRQQGQSPMNQNSYPMHQSEITSDGGYQSSGGSSDMERILQSRMAATLVAAGMPHSQIEAALAHQGNENQSQQQQAANFELYQRLQQHHQQHNGDPSHGGANNGFPHFHTGGR